MLRRLLLSTLPCFAIAFLATPVFAQDAETKKVEKKPVSMFDGKSLTGWTQKNGWAKYEAKDGTIVGTTANGSPNSFLCTVKEYGDFELQFEVKVDNRLNSGVQIRSQTRDQAGKNNIYKPGRVNGPQIEIEASGKNGGTSAFVYGEACGGWLSPASIRKDHKKFKDGEWNHYKVIAKGPQITVYLNGDKISDHTYEKNYKTHPKGFIGLQVHGIGRNQGPYQVAWRNLTILEL